MEKDHLIKDRQNQQAMQYQKRHGHSIMDLMQYNLDITYTAIYIEIIAFA